MSAGKVLAILFKGGEYNVPKLLGSAENALGIQKFLADNGRSLYSTSDKGVEIDEHIKDAEIIISTPFNPAYISKERLESAKNLKLLITAGVGSDHIDLDYINKSGRKISVLEVTGSNTTSVAEHVLLTILALVKNFIPAHEDAIAGGWNIAKISRDAYDLEGKTVATIGAGRIGYKVLERLYPFKPKELLYYDYQPLSKELESKVNARRVDTVEELVSQADIVTINAPLHAGTKGLVNKELLSKFKPGSLLVNTARGAICDAQAVADAVKSGQLRGYGGDVWYPQPAPLDHPWRNFTNKYGGGNAMTPHVSGSNLDAQARYSEGVKNILTSYFTGKLDYRPQDVILLDGEYVTKSYGADKKVVGLK
ncbi:CYFA0S01e19504g1_1 [Cyberlindnera fabianii]|uniref:Formate dehydrogenase n=1 Tax=Cyberlindnera fabianii TaxID=36022 RepID=A0A061ATE4_CYBFA|nr:Formate dehydrogenase [Cyberlindnera fabianii]CDR37951.1 CYFA0S01e19504g1_1 [Cyberlindnera fabianii]